MIEYGGGVRTQPAIFRSLADHSGLTMNPTRGRRMVEARRRLLDHYESTP